MNELPQINIVSYLTGSGLGHDVEILLNLLKAAGYSVTWTKLYWSPPPKGRIQRRVHALWLRLQREIPAAWHRLRYGRSIYVLNIFVQDIDPCWLSSAQYNWLIPNQEWFRHGQVQFLKKMDLIICKTYHAQAIFNSLRCKTDYISFTSRDYYNSTIKKDFNHYFHMPGRSPLKGTEEIVALWKKHPEWPHLTIVQTPNSKVVHVEQSLTNLTYRYERLSDHDLGQLSNHCGVHLCPSRSEGFGHYVNEALAVAALVVTTDGPPMNELVDRDRGILVPWSETEPRQLGTDYKVDLVALERAIETVIQMTEAEKAALGQRARAWYLANDRFFRRRFLDVLSRHIPEFRDRIHTMGRVDESDC